MATILPFDEINRLEVSIRERYGAEKLKRSDYEDIIDELLDLFLLAYARANEVTNMNLESDWIPSIEDVMRIVDERVKDKTWRERVKEYSENSGSVDDIVRIIETESHRIANESALDTAKKAGAKTKTWATMLDDRVRETHDYLEGVTVKINEDFYTYDGDSASAPGMFTLASNNVNCRCELVFGK